MKRILLVLLIMSCNLLFGFDDLFEYKLKLQDKFKPEKEWLVLDHDDSFALSFNSTDSFIKMGMCLEFKDRKFYIVDNIQHKIVVFSDSGKFIKNIGQTGKGPGDLYFPGWLCFFGDKIYISNNNGIEIFAEDYSFKNRIRPFLTIHRFSVLGNNIFLNPTGGYRERFPLLLKLNDKGGVIGGYYDENVENSYLKYDKEGIPAVGNKTLIFVPCNWNSIYILDHNSNLKKKIKIGYSLLDELEKWNDRPQNKSGGQSVWFCNMIASAKIFRDKLYILLNLPRLEILQFDLNGRSEGHYYNDTVFKYMRWFDFSFENKGDETIFYIMGFSEKEGEKQERLEFNVYRMKSGKLRSD